MDKQPAFDHDGLSSRTECCGATAVPTPPASDDATFQEIREQDTAQLPPFVRIPDCFGSFLAPKPIVNPSYFAVKAQGERWIARHMGFDKKAAVKNMQADFCYLASIWTWHEMQNFPLTVVASPSLFDWQSKRISSLLRCTVESRALMLDWINWIFFFDDEFDEGRLKTDLDAASEEVRATMAILEGKAPRYSPDSNRIRYIFQTCCDGVRATASEEMQYRWIVHHERYLKSLLVQVDLEARGANLACGIDDYFDLRRGSIGVHAAITLAEWAGDIKVPTQVYEHPSLQKCMEIVSDLVLLFQTGRYLSNEGHDIQALATTFFKCCRIGWREHRMHSSTFDPFRGSFSGLVSHPISPKMCITPIQNDSFLHSAISP
ncbi:hypothetical protein DE146DRAFT_732278 [Phaeosphaeria sp. MPI-PUGE-AT-0046c]|nr:hypothetical protein DE146DRAFT_732278 [Phaeosphaeria sp. MPI-PUGE-AT-0046c]